MNMWWSEENKGLLKTKFTGVPLLLFVSKSEIYSEKPAHNEKPGGIVYTLHITPFIAVGFVIPQFLLRRKQ